MSISNAKHHAHLAKYASNSDAERLKHLVETVYDLAYVLEQLDQTVGSLKGRIEKIEFRKH